MALGMLKEQLIPLDLPRFDAVLLNLDTGFEEPRNLVPYSFKREGL